MGNSKMKTVLITGVAGNVGSALAEALLRQNNYSIILSSTIILCKKSSSGFAISL